MQQKSKAKVLTYCLGVRRIKVQYNLLCVVFTARSICREDAVKSFQSAKLMISQQLLRDNLQRQNQYQLFVIGPTNNFQKAASAKHLQDFSANTKRVISFLYLDCTVYLD